VPAELASAHTFLLLKETIRHEFIKVGQ